MSFVALRAAVRAAPRARVRNLATEQNSALKSYLAEEAATEAHAKGQTELIHCTPLSCHIQFML